MPTRRALLQSSLLLPAIAPAWIAQEDRVAGGKTQNVPWLEKIAQQLKEEFHLAAVWLAAGSDGALDQAVAGVRKQGDPTPAALEDRLMVASISKPMTGVWLASLVEQGKIAYESRLLDVLPELREGCLPEHQDITLAQLATHTAGLVRDADNWMVDMAHPERDPQERLRFGREALRRPTPPEAKGHSFYSNVGMTLAGAMGERAAGVPYQKAITAFYQEVVKLPSWGLGAANRAGDLTGAWPHDMRKGVPVPTPPEKREWFRAQPSGGAHCTIGDLARFGKLAIQGYRGGDKVLKPGTWKRILTPVPDAISTLGSFQHAFWDVATFYHQGGLGGASSELWTLPEFDLVLAIHTTAFWPETGSNLPFLTRAHDLVLDALRERRSATRAPRSTVTISRVFCVDASGKEIQPRRTDNRVRVCVEFVVATPHCGDLKVTAKLGDEERQANWFRGMDRGTKRATFDWKLPEKPTAPFVAIVDACHSCGDSNPDYKRFEAPFTLS